MEASHKNFQVIVKNVHTFDGKNAPDFIEWYEKIRISLKAALYAIDPRSSYFAFNTPKYCRLQKINKCG